MVIKSWIAKIFKIPQLFYVTYKKDGKKILIICGVNSDGKKIEEKFLVKNLLNNDLEVTEQTLDREMKMFAKFSSNK